MPVIHQQTHDIKTRIGMMIGITAEEIHMTEIVETTMDIMRQKEALGMLTTATSMNP